MFDNMTEEKLKKTITGMVVAGTVLVVILLGVIFYQFVSMGSKNAQIDSIKEQIQQYEEQKDNLEEELSIYQTDKKKEYLARQHGYVYPDDKTAEDLLK